MKAEHHLNHSQRLQLGANESLHIQTRAGSALISHSGRLLLTSTPGWLGEQVCRATTPLEPGQMHTLAESGWVTLKAGPQGATLHLMQRQADATLAQALGKACKALRAGLLASARMARARLRGAGPA
ncbi:hypothetical protein SAMN05216344_11627 [Polaromonas sp. OV174]|uniref:hypothetical protein n=1 Tax=Polaromonas sp. OV174 TaxID=1855300 RepID=UPI0008E161C6|nr:hypothetical protein [Polaromonas sp. OV174]SFC39634.1 hypothetical protein SAMN05216344_11627 [Polaromonas sp. OV174]